MGEVVITLGEVAVGVWFVLLVIVGLELLIERWENRG